jgi:signal peptidase I
MWTWKRIWRFLWHEDSIASWIVNIILAFIIIKFIVYPALGFALGTSYPIVAVVSGSMEHSYNRAPDGAYALCGQTRNDWEWTTFEEYWNTCGNWYEERNVSKEEFREFDFRNGFNKGDIIILTGRGNIDVGDVIVFWNTRPDPIIHRVVEINGGYRTKGDHNSRDDGVTANEKVIGKATIRVPFLGWIKIAFVEFINLFRR